jgi:hypothetical protein
LLRRRRGHEAAARLHDEELSAKAPLFEALAQIGEVAADDRAKVGVERGRVRALVFLPLGGDVARE